MVRDLISDVRSRPGPTSLSADVPAGALHSLIQEENPKFLVLDDCASYPKGKQSVSASAREAQPCATCWKLLKDAQQRELERSCLRQHAEGQGARSLPQLLRLRTPPPGWMQPAVTALKLKSILQWLHEEQELHLLCMCSSH